MIWVRAHKEVVEAGWVVEISWVGVVVTSWVKTVRNDEYKNITVAWYRRGCIWKSFFGKSLLWSHQRSNCFICRGLKNAKKKPHIVWIKINIKIVEVHFLTKYILNSTFDILLSILDWFSSRDLSWLSMTEGTGEVLGNTIEHEHWHRLKNSNQCTIYILHRFDLRIIKQTLTYTFFFTTLLASPVLIFTIETIINAYSRWHCWQTHRHDCSSLLYGQAMTLHWEWVTSFNPKLYQEKWLGELIDDP